MRHALLRMTVTLIVLTAVPSWGQGTPPDVLVEGTKTGTPLDQMIGGVTILDAEEIRSFHTPSVVEVLRQVEGLDVVQSGGPGGQTSLFVRGGHSNHVLVVIDGVKVNSPTSGAFDLAHLTVDQIERIEILRGPQSPLYGSEAGAGVVNIITTRGREGNRDSLSAGWGSYRTWRGSLSHSDRGPVWDRMLSIARSSSKGISRADARNGNTEPDGYANTTFATRWGRGVGVGGRLDLNARLIDGTTDIDEALPPTYAFADSPGKTRNKLAIVGASLGAPLSPWWDHRLTIGWSRDHTSPTGSLYLEDIDAQSRQLEWRHTLAIGDDNLLTVGYEYQHRAARYGSAYDQAIITNSAYLQDQLAAFDPLIVNIALRSDGNNRFGRFNTYRIGSSLAVSSGTRIFGNYGTGFRGPTLNDLYAPYGSNPDLEPETSRGYEAGVSHRQGSLTVGATYFNTRYHDLIAPDPTAPFFVYLPVNLETAFARGVETTVELRAPKSRIEASHTYTATRDGSTDDQLLRRPRNKAGLALVFEPDQDSRLRVDYRYVGERLDYGGPLSPYAVVNLAASQRITDGEIFLRLENLFDREYEEVAGYGTPGRSLYGGVNITF